jgi:uncharacterized protein (DUF608 family)
MPLFEVKDFGKLVQHDVAGFDQPIPAICYRGTDLKSPFPIGGLATGYVELRPDGKLGLFSLYNNYVPLGTSAGTPLLTLIDASGKEIPLDAERADISILAHFPVCNVRYALKNSKAIIWLRLFTPVIPGDADTSNTPGVLLDISSEEFTGKVRVEFAIAHNVEPIVKPIDFANSDLRGAGRRYFKREDYRASFVIGWLDDAPGQAQAADDRIHLTLTGDISPKTSRSAVFAWHLPWWIDTGGEPHMNRYATGHKDAVDVAKFLKTNSQSLYKRVYAWQAALYKNCQPDWLANALVQSLYSYAKNTVWVDEHRADRWYEPDGFFVHSESFRGCPIAETMVCRQHGHIATLLLWPELEKSTLAGFAHFQNRQGEIPFSFGQPNALRDPRFHCQHPLTSSQFVQMIHRYLVRTGDEEFAKRLWSNVADAMKYCAFLDNDDDGLINEHAHALPGDNWPANQFYDQWPWHGTSSYVASTGLAAQRAYAALADRLGHRDAHDDAMKQAARGLASFRNKLWNGNYFRLWRDDKLGDNETCLANQLMGQWCVRVAGLEPIFDEAECKKVFTAVEKYNASATKFGLVNGGNFQGDVTVAGDPNDNQGIMIFVGENLCAAMTGMYEQYPAAESWARKLVMTIHELQASPFDQHCLMRHDNAAPGFGNDYYSNLVVWALPMAVQRIGLAEFCKRGRMIDQMIEAGKPA